LADDATTFRLCVYPNPRLVAEFDRESIQQDDADDAARNPRDQQAGTHRSNSPILRGDQRRPSGVPLEVQNGRDHHCIDIKRTVMKPPPSPPQVSTPTEKKSAPASTSKCDRMNSFQVVVRLRSGAGAMLCRRKILPTVWSET